MVFTGELDLVAIDDIRDAIAGMVSHDGAGVIVDLRAVTFMDSSSLQALLHAAEDARVRGGGMTVRVAGGSVARLFELTGVMGYLDVRS